MPYTWSLDLTGPGAEMFLACMALWRWIRIANAAYWTYNSASTGRERLRTSSSWPAFHEDFREVEWWSGGVMEWWSNGVVEWWRESPIFDAGRCEQPSSAHSRSRCRT